jgi:hypothetical protein
MSDPNKQRIIDLINTKGLYKNELDKQRSFKNHATNFYLYLKKSPTTATYEQYAKGLGWQSNAAMPFEKNVLMILGELGLVSSAAPKVSRVENTAVQASAQITEEEIQQLLQKVLEKNGKGEQLQKIKFELSPREQEVFQTKSFKDKMFEAQRMKSQAAAQAKAEAAAVAPPLGRVVVAAPQAIPRLIGFCGINNPKNWCYLNSSIQFLNDIPELKAGILALTDAQIRDSGKLYIDSARENLVKDTLQILKKVYETIRDNAGRGPISFSGTMIDRKNVYQAFIDLVRVADEEAKVLYNIREAKKPAAKRRAFEFPFVYGEQSDADEFIFRILAFVFASNLELAGVVKYLFTYERFEYILCDDKTLGENGKIDSNNILDYSLDIPIEKGYTQEGQPIYVTSIQDAVNFQEAPEVLVEGENMLSVCGKDGKKGKASQKGAKFRIFPFTKYLFIKLKRLTDGQLYYGKIDVNKVLTIDGVQFQPRGVVYHRGGIDKRTGKTGGHYIYYHFENGDPTIECDDFQVTQIIDKKATMTSLNGNGGGGARVILYERITPVDMGLARQVQDAQKRILNAKERNFLAKFQEEKASRAAVENISKKYEGISRERLENLQRSAKNEKLKSNIGKMLTMFEKTDERSKSFKNISNSTLKQIRSLLAPLPAPLPAPLGDLERERDEGLAALAAEEDGENENCNNNDASSTASSNSIELVPQANNSASSNSNNASSTSSNEPDERAIEIITLLEDMGVKTGELDDYTTEGLEKRLAEELAKQSSVSAANQAAIAKVLAEENQGAPPSPRTAKLIADMQNPNFFTGGKRKTRKQKKGGKRRTTRKR